MNNKIFVNSRFLTQKVTGSQRFAIEISKQLKKLDPERFVFVAPNNIIHNDLSRELGVRIIGINTGHVWEQIDLPLYLKKHGSPLLLNLVNTAPIFYENKIVVVHDISWLHFPDWISKRFYLWYNFLIPKIVVNSRYVFSVSEFSKRDIIEKLNLQNKNFGVVYNAVSESFKPMNVSKEATILSVASLNRYKNLQSLIKSFILLKEKRNFLNYKLILIGGYNRKVFAKNNILKVSKDRDDVLFIGHVDDDDKLVEYYNKAELFVFPSLFESFGIPPLEAMACGCPVVCSNVASLPEVCGDAAYYVNPYDVNDIANGIERVLTDDKLRQDLIKKGFENVKRFSWEKSAKKIIEVINNL